MYRRAVTRRYTYPLKAGHRAAILCAETTEYRYMRSEQGEQLAAPKRWFKANVDTILKIFGVQHSIQREDLFLSGYQVWILRCLVLILVFFFA